MTTFRKLPLALAALACCLAAASADAAVKKSRSVRKPAVRAAAKPPAAPAQPAAETPWRRTPYVGALAADEKGRVLFASNADQPARPASVTKLMTALLVLEDVAAGRYGFGSEVKPSAEVYKSEPSSMDLKPGVPVTVEQLLSGLMVRSANDSALALAEWSALNDPDCAKSESTAVPWFVGRMNARAAALGMDRTKYFNPNGLPPNKKFDTTDFNVTTCR
ncbi:MAG: serine hydrolase, partial [Kiritimatiellae bacterium]|nr:serine hydrolase [Kiritimatiellia bacterium]